MPSTIDAKRLDGKWRPKKRKRKSRADPEGRKLLAGNYFPRERPETVKKLTGRRRLTSRLLVKARPLSGFWNAEKYLKN